jgi:general secretion pathway protein G
MKRIKNSDELREKIGFTLLEILIVVVIIGILASIVGVTVIPRLGQAKSVQAKAQIAKFKTALQLYHMDNGMYPTQEQGLEALCSKPTIPPVPEKYPEQGYLDAKHVPLDPWGRKYIYLVPGREGEPFEVISYGKDGEKGGTGENADISSSDL